MNGFAISLIACVRFMTDSMKPNTHAIYQLTVTGTGYACARKIYISFDNILSNDSLYQVRCVKDIRYDWHVFKGIVFFFFFSCVDFEIQESSTKIKDISKSIMHQRDF